VSAIAADIQVDRAALGEQSASFEGDLVRPGIGLQSLGPVKRLTAEGDGHGVAGLELRVRR
jgi:hypothetical protein